MRLMHKSYFTSVGGDAGSEVVHVYSLSERTVKKHRYRYCGN